MAHVCEEVAFSFVGFVRRTPGFECIIARLNDLRFSALAFRDIHHHANHTPRLTAWFSFDNGTFRRDPTNAPLLGNHAIFNVEVLALPPPILVTRLQDPVAVFLVDRLYIHLARLRNLRKSIAKDLGPAFIVDADAGPEINIPVPQVTAADSQLQALLAREQRLLGPPSLLDLRRKASVPDQKRHNDVDDDNQRAGNNFGDHRPIDLLLNMDVDLGAVLTGNGCADSVRRLIDTAHETPQQHGPNEQHSPTRRPSFPKPACRVVAPRRLDT